MPVRVSETAMATRRVLVALRMFGRTRTRHTQMLVSSVTPTRIGDTIPLISTT